MQEAYIVSAVRTPIGKAPRGSLRNTRPDDLAAFAIKAAIERVPGLDPSQIEDVVLGCAVPEAEQGMNVARIAVLRAGLPVTVPAATVNRMCASGLEAIAIIAQRIQTGQIDVGIAGGTESMSMVPMEGHVFRPNPYLTKHYPDAYLGMGMTTENLVAEFGITREEADQFAYESHQKALRAQAEGAFEGEIVPVEVHERIVKDGTVHENRFVFERDEGPRADTSLEALAKLKPVFKVDGTVTAGNASQRSDGAAAVVLMSERKVKELGIQPIGRFVNYALAGVPPETMGIGPAYAIPKLLQKTGKSLHEIDLFEINEAFAAQVLAVLRQLPDLPRERLNVNGGAVALGHPLGATGARMTATLLNALGKRGGRWGIVSMCVGGGMGAAGLFERF
ncbi:acetyl-CoA acyltransferase [Armatimonadetes bacterium DC]|nr:acetyl-CoA acyltransferase [Armatimonadetes bacterium DC]